MKFTYIVFSMLIFSGILLGLGSFYNDLSVQYGTGYNNTTGTALTMQSNVQTIYGTALNETNSTEGGLSGGANLWTIFGFIFKAPIYIGKAFLGTGGKIMDAVNTLALYLAIPTWVLGIISLAVSLVVIFAVIRLVWNKEM